LNKTCFNGLYRVNRSGGFNVPIGSYKNPKICDTDNLRLAAKAFEDTIILNGDYAETLRYANSETLFYLDPPYKPISATSSFNAYAKASFDDQEQVRLSEFCRELTKRETAWILSNSDVNTEDNPDKFFDELYDGFDIQRVKASRVINSVSAKRGRLNELLISNI
jgi:DNA adenine methylase